MKNALKIVFAITLVVMVSGVASAASITGTINLGSPVANIKVPTMNSAEFIGNPSFTAITPATGDFAGSTGMTGMAVDIMSNGPILGFLMFDGFIVDVVNFLGGPDVWTLYSVPPTTIASFSFSALIHKVGYDNTPGTGVLTAQYAGGFNSQEVVGWSLGLTAHPVPEPATYATLGAALVTLAMLRRRHRSFQAGKS